MRRCAIVSFRLGGTDGVSIEAEKWGLALVDLGFEVTTVAGEGPVDVLVEGLGIGGGTPTAAALDDAIGDAELVVVENVCSLPLNPGAARAVAIACRGRPAILHHHDLPWQRSGSHHCAPPTDPLWRHVTINELSRHELSRRGIEATTIYNRFDTNAMPGQRDQTRVRLGVGTGERLVLQPTRAIGRKNVAGGVSLAERLGASFWLPGPVEDGYGPELEKILARARCPVLREPVPLKGPWSMADAYAAADVVVLPSSWEGFGNPTLEAAVHKRPLCVGHFPVARELVTFGFRWFPLDDSGQIDRWLDMPDAGLLDHNWTVADRHFSLRDLPTCLAAVIESKASTPPLLTPGY
ncbi:MAG: glycosyltransferase [Acidimicrobiales bacterium]